MDEIQALHTLLFSGTTSKGYDIMKPERASQLITLASITPVGNNVIIVTDGACSKNGQPDSIGGWAALLIQKNGEYYLCKTISGKFTPATNNQAEIMGVNKGLAALSTKVDTAAVITDSSYTIGAFTGNKRKMNVDLLEATDKIIAEKAKHIKWKHVDGHSGILVNEYVDEIAAKEAGSTRNK